MIHKIGTLLRPTDCKPTLSKLYTWQLCVPFDIDTGYYRSDASQLPYLKAMIDAI